MVSHPEAAARISFEIHVRLPLMRLSSVCSEISGASPTSIPRYRTVLPAYYAQAGAERPVDSSSVCRSTSPWSDALCVCHRPTNQGRQRQSTDEQFARTAELIHGVICRDGWETDIAPASSALCRSKLLRHCGLALSVQTGLAAEFSAAQPLPVEVSGYRV